MQKQVECPVCRGRVFEIEKTGALKCVGCGSLVLVFIQDEVVWVSVWHPWGV